MNSSHHQKLYTMLNVTRRRRRIPEWENALCTAIGNGLVAMDLFDRSSSRRGNIIYKSEFEIPGSIHVRFESRPSRHWGAVDVSIVVSLTNDLASNEAPEDITPLLSPKGTRQGAATAMACIYDTECGTPGISLLYVSRQLQRRWRHVCQL